MSKNISRRNFLKGVTVSAVGLAGMTLLPGCASGGSEENGIYTPGTYTATAKGMGTVTVTATFDANSITKIELDVSNETESIGQAAKDELIEQMMKAQSSEIDGVSGATVTATACKEALDNCIAQAKGLEAVSGTTEASDWKTEPVDVDASAIEKTYDADVAVVGLGYAGLNCVRYLASKGVNVIGFDSQAEDTFQAMGNEGAAPNSKVLAERGVPAVDKIEYYNNWMINSGYQANPGLVMKWVQNAGDGMDEWLSVLDDEQKSVMTTAFYPPVDKQMDHIGAFRFWPCTASFYSMEVNQTLISSLNRAKAVEDGSTLLYSADAYKLIKNDAGEVTGVLASIGNEKFIQINAKAVVLAAGGFGANQQMQKDLLTDLGGCLTPDEEFQILMDSDGRGVQLGYWAGTKIDSLGIPTMNGKHFHPGEPHGLWLNWQGKRYCNEFYGPIEFRGRPALQQARDHYFSFYDSNLPENMRYCVPSHGSTQGTEENINNVRETLKQALEAGKDGVEGRDLSAVYTRYGAETLDELLDIVCDSDDLKDEIRKSIDRYNDLCAKGVDEDFGRESELMFPIKDGPFYCDVKVPTIGWMMCTCGGLVINEEQQCLDEYFHPIKGLFASGNCASGRFGTEYFTPTPGVSLGTVITLGRECGKSVEKYLNGEI
ncbi:MAG: FAD-binding protein [Bulleidia sp.]